MRVQARKCAMRSYDPRSNDRKRTYRLDVKRSDGVAKVSHALATFCYGDPAVRRIRRSSCYSISAAVAGV